MTTLALAVLLVCIAVNLVCTWYNFRSMRAYYRAHDLLLSLCLHAWRMRHRQQVFPLYDDTIGRHWRSLMRRR